MRKIIYALVAVLSFSSLNAQKKFFDSHEFVAFHRFDNNTYTATEWKSVFAPGKIPQSQKIDSLVDDGLGEVRGRALNPGLQVRFQKILPVLKPVSKSRIEWNLGGGFHMFDQGGPIYSARLPEIKDTNTYYQAQIEIFEQSQFNFDLYTSLNFVTGAKKLNLYFGAGVEYSLPIGNHKIKELHGKTTIRYNKATRQWQAEPNISSAHETKSVSVEILSLTVPVGVLFKLSNHYQLKAGAEYLYSVRFPNTLSPSQGLLAQIGIRYNWF